MPTYLDWAREKLLGAPASSCAFWIDLQHLLARRNGGILADVDAQPLLDDAGNEWTIVPYRANPMSARRLLAEPGKRVVVWCLGSQPPEPVNLTPLEDHLGRAWSIVDVSLTAIADEMHPELGLPPDISSTLKGVTFDVVAYTNALAAEAKQTLITKSVAANTLVRLTTGCERGLNTSSPAAAVASSATCHAFSANENAAKALRLALDCAADTDARYAALLTAIAQSDARDVLATAYVGSGLARLGVGNIGSLLAAEGFCPPDLRDSFESVGGRWQDLAGIMLEDELGAVAECFERIADPSVLTRLRDLLRSSNVSLQYVVKEPLPALRLAGLLARSEEFIDGEWSARTGPLVTEGYSEELGALDGVASAIRCGQEASHGYVPASRELDALADAFVSSSICHAGLDVARGKVAFQQIADILEVACASRVAQRLVEAEALTSARMEEWDRAWAGAIREGLSAYKNHERQAWRRASDFAGQMSGRESWLLIFDGLRYDLWKTIVAPALRDAGWTSLSKDFSYSCVPTTTNVCRPALVAGAIDNADAAEPKLAQAIAERYDVQATYAVRAEHMGGKKEEAKDWNVRVFSWPDKFAHSDIADLGPLAAQFELWVRNEFVPWLKRNVSRLARIAVSADHGFVTLSPENAIDVEKADPSDRNSARVLKGAFPELVDVSLTVDVGGELMTVAAADEWFRAPGARYWRFAHGGCTMHETIVPFAELALLSGREAEILIEGLPKGLRITEGEERVLEFSVKVSGGTEMFATISVKTNLASLHQEQVVVGTEKQFAVPVRGTEGLKRLVVIAACGPERAEAVVNVEVELGKLKRTELDLDL